MYKLSILFLVYLFTDVKSQRIAGGAVTSIANYPFAAALLSNNGAGAYVHACGGTILTSSAILSAASCFYTNGDANPVSWWRARVGSSYANSGGTIYLVNRITPHTDFNAQTLANDLAVLRTTLNIGFQADVTEAARIAGAAYTLNQNQQVWAIGWGAVSAQIPSSEELRTVQIWVANQDTCTNRYNTVGFAVSANMVCAGWLDVGIRGQCEGDSGSPLLDSDGAVVGVYSWGEGCGQGWFPGINTRIAPYTRWIVDTATA